MNQNIVAYIVVCLLLLSVSCTDKPNLPFNQTCQDMGGTASVAEPRFLRNLSIGNTGWFSSPAVFDLDHDGENEIIAPFYDIAVWDTDGNLIYREERIHHSGRVYAPSVIADLEGDGIVEIVVAAGEGSVASYEWYNQSLHIKEGWPTTTCVAGTCFENRSLAADDLDGDGDIEIVVSSTLSQQPSGYEGTNPLYSFLNQTVPLERGGHVMIPV